MAIPTIVTSIEFKEIQKTYDIEVSGRFPNFFANNIIVHNSKSTASSRAIPVAKQVEKVEREPFVPSWIGRAQSGMQANEELSSPEKEKFIEEWKTYSKVAAQFAMRLDEMNIHKQIANRVIEPWSYVKTIVSATDWDNLFVLRCNKDAQHEFQVLAYRMLEAYLNSTPVERTLHMPFGHQMEPGLSEADQILVACARCARISYETHDGIRDANMDIALAKKLIDSGHMSPFEHVARANPFSDTYTGNFRGWIQRRKLVANETHHKADLKKLFYNKPNWI